MMSFTESSGTLFNVSAQSPARITDVARESNLSSVSAFPKSGNVAVAVPFLLPMLTPILLRAALYIMWHRMPFSNRHGHPNRGGVPKTNAASCGHKCFGSAEGTLGFLAGRGPCAVQSFALPSASASHDSIFPSSCERGALGPARWLKEPNHLTRETEPHEV